MRLRVIESSNIHKSFYDFCLFVSGIHLDYESGIRHHSSGHLICVIAIALLHPSPL